MQRNPNSRESRRIRARFVARLVGDIPAFWMLSSALIPLLALVTVLLLAPIAVCSAQAPPTANPDPTAIAAFDQVENAPTKFDRLVTRIILESMPHKVVDEDQWGQTREAWDGVKVWWENGRLETKRRRKTVNHGTWKRYEIRLVDPEQRFQVRVENLRQTPDGRVEFDAQVDAAMDIFGRISEWQRDVQLYSFSANASAVVRLRVTCSLMMRLDPTKLPPDVILDPKITSADLQLVQFRLHRISDVGGAVAHELGKGVREILEHEIRQRREKTVDKVNHQIEKHRDDLRLSISELLATQWGELAAKSLDSF